MEEIILFISLMVYVLIKEICPRIQLSTNVLAGINDEDIESVTVLKDAVSTAAYGADAGAGVIIITTKSGKKGDAKYKIL